MSDTTPPESVEPSRPASGGEQELQRGFNIEHYVVLERIGRGGMGVVYAAYDPELDRKLAVKLLRKPGGSPERRARMFDEARALARLSHPNVVTVHDVGGLVDQVFIVMEFMAGGTLTKWLAKQPRAPLEIVDAFAAAGEGLAAAHQSGLVHRDFKPDNVMLDAQGVPHVTDFGLANALDDDKALGKLVGTPGFMAPEQARRERVDARADQFSFCASLYLALYRKLPLPKDHDFTKPLPAIEPSSNNVPAWVKRAVLRGLSEDPSQRWPDMEALLAALRADPARKLRSRLVAAASVISAVALLVLGLMLATRPSEEERAQAECIARVNAEADAVWSATRRAEIEEAFSRANGSYTWSRLRDRLGGEATRWRETAVETCRLPRNDPARRRLQACLEERRTTLQSMSDLFAAADVGVAKHAFNTVMVEVLPVESCRSGKAPEAPVFIKPEIDDSMRSGLARARVLKAAGKYTEALVEARGVANLAEDAKAPRVKAEAQLLVGELHALQGRADGEDNLRVAIVTAEAVGNDEVRARAWIALMKWYSDRRRFSEATLANRVASSILERLGRPPLLEAARLNQEGELYALQDEQFEAQLRFQEAVELQNRQQMSDDHPLVLRSLNNLANALPPARAIPLFEKVLATRRKALGPEHPETAVALYNLGTAQLEAENCQAALPLYEEAVSVQQRNPQDEPVWLGRYRVALSQAFECLQRLDEAAEQRQRGVAMLREAAAPDDEQRENLEALKALLVALKRPSKELAVVDAALEPFKSRRP